MSQGKPTAVCAIRRIQDEQWTPLVPGVKRSEEFAAVMLLGLDLRRPAGALRNFDFHSVEG